MARESCLIVRPRDDATFDECQLVGLALTMRRPPFDFIQDGDDYVVFVDAPRSVRRTEKAIMHALAESEIVEAVITPLVVGHKAADGGYTYESWFDEPDPEPEPAVQAPEIAYCVSLSPPSVFGWRALREELQRQGRTVIAERGDAIEVGVRDKTDALVSEIDRCWAWITGLPTT